jgi:hypothetical protein
MLAPFITRPDTSTPVTRIQPIGTVHIEDRFWSKVDKTPGHGPNGDCWAWKGTMMGLYGAFAVSGKNTGAHRFSYALANGPIASSKLFVCHRCDNPTCVNPAHLFLGEHQDNVADKVAKGRCHNGNNGKTHCKRGHEFTKENTLIIRDGGRNCRQCVRDARSSPEYKAARNARRRAAYQLKK